MFDLARPFCATTAVMPRSNWKTVFAAKLLNPISSRRVKRGSTASGSVGGVGGVLDWANAIGSVESSSTLDLRGIGNMNRRILNRFTCPVRLIARQWYRSGHSEGGLSLTA